jgi:hypothetical protein
MLFLVVVVVAVNCTVLPRGMLVFVGVRDRRVGVFVLVH